MPLPLPLLPDVMVMNVALLTAVHAQPAPAVTLTLAEPPPAAKLALVGLIENVHVPPHSDGKSVAAMCVVPSLPTAETPMP